MRTHYIRSVIPLLCAHEELSSLRELLSFSSLHDLAECDDAYRVSLAVPVLVSDGLIGRATGAISRLAKTPEHDWLNTECVRFGVTEVQRLEAEGSVALEESEKFRYVFIKLLASFRGQWFSRAHDREFIISMLAILQDIDRYTDYHQRDVIRAAIRHFGLCRDFWQQFELKKLHVDHPEFQRAHVVWMTLLEALGTPCQVTSEQLRTLRRSLAYFHSHNNYEVMFFARELMVHRLAASNEELNDLDRDLIDWILTENPAEGIRIAAFPFAGKNKLLDHLPEIANDLNYNLRQLTANKEHPAGIVNRMQSLAAVALQRAKDAGSNADNVVLTAALREVERHALQLGNWAGMFLGADLLASAWMLAYSRGLDCDRFTSLWLTMARRVLQEVDGNHFLPAPITAGLNRLSSLKKDVLACGLMVDLRKDFAAKFGEKYQSLFVPPVSPVMTSENLGWPQDTLVVIYSCRRNLNTRVLAIRDTWINDLKQWRIPDAVLVGGGDDTLADDILALDVSGTNRHRSQ